jgi:predicted YcjX-like family ATPase
MPLSILYIDVPGVFLLDLWLSSLSSPSLSTYVIRLKHSLRGNLALNSEALADFTSGGVDYVGGILFSTHHH